MVLVFREEFTELLQTPHVVVTNVDMQVGWVQHDILGAEVCVSWRLMDRVQLVETTGEVLGNDVLVFSVEVYSGLVQVLVQRNLLGLEDVHHAGLLREAHAFNWQEVLVVQVLQCCGLLEDGVNHLRLDFLEADYSREHWEGWLPLLVECFDLVEWPKGPALLSLVELLVETEFILRSEDAVGEGEGLTTGR